MALKWNVNALDELAPEVAALYVPDAERGGYRLDVTEPDAIRKALHVERDARATAERIAKVAEASLATHEADRAAAREAKAQRDLAVAREAALRSTLLEARVAEAARTAGLHAAAIPDALRAARDLFAVADDGNAVPKSGKQSLTDWFAQQRDVSPHWFPAFGGSGAPQSQRPSTLTAISRARFDSLSPAQKQAVVRDGITVKD